LDPFGPRFLPPPPRRFILRRSTAPLPGRRSGLTFRAIAAKSCRRPWSLIGRKSGGKQVGGMAQPGRCSASHCHRSGRWFEAPLAEAGQNRCFFPDLRRPLWPGKFEGKQGPTAITRRRWLLAQIQPRAPGRHCIRRGHSGGASCDHRPRRFCAAWNRLARNAGLSQEKISWPSRRGETKETAGPSYNRPAAHLHAMRLRPAGRLLHGSWQAHPRIQSGQLTFNVMAHQCHDYLCA